VLPKFSYGGIEQKNWNPLLGRGRGVDGLKTGYLKTSGYHILFSAQENDQSLIGVVMGGPTPKMRNQDALELLAYGFNNFATRAAVKEGEIVGKVAVPNGEPPELELSAAKTLMVTVRTGRAGALPIRNEAPASVKAPITQGSIVGKMVLEGEGFPRQEIDLVATRDVAVKSYTKYLVIGLAGVLGLMGLVLVRHSISGKRRF
jgi:D-alanyl-D-alanine carboxypeptidase (penicillin-binding protein 5/6)